MRQALADRSWLCESEEPQFLAPPYRWALVLEAPQAACRDGSGGRHPRSAEWEQAYGRAISGQDCSAQLETVTTVAQSPADRQDRGVQARSHGGDAGRPAAAGRPDRDGRPGGGTRRGHAVEARTSATAVTHFHGEFKARRLDLYTDGDRWASADSSRREQTAAEKGDMPGHLPTGQELVDSAADNNPAKADRIRSKLYEQSDDVLDTLEKNANIGESIFARPPTGSYEGSLTR